jgi:hypothetical protein
MCESPGGEAIFRAIRSVGEGSEGAAEGLSDD